MHSKKLLSVLLALTLVCACVVGMLVVNASASAETKTLTVQADGDTDENPDTFASLSGALAEITQYNNTWADEAKVTITIAEGAGAQTVSVDNNGILFGLPTQFRENGTRLPIEIIGGELTFGDFTGNVASANNVLFQGMTFAFGKSEIDFYAGSGMVEFSSVDLGATNGADCVADFFGDNFTAAAFAGWAAPAEGELIETGIIFSGEMDYGLAVTAESGANSATAGRLFAAGWTETAWVGATANDAITAADTSVSFITNGTWTDDSDGTIEAAECSVTIGHVLGRGYKAKSPVAEVNVSLTNTAVTGYTLGARGESSSAANANHANFGNMDLNLTLNGGYYAYRIQGIQNVTMTGDFNITVTDGFLKGVQLRADNGSNTIYGKAVLTVNGKPVLNNSSGTVHNVGISGVFSATEVNENHIYADMSAGAASQFVASRGASKGPVENYVYAGANLKNFYGLGGTTNMAQTYPVTNTIYEGATITNFYGAGSSSTGTLAEVNNVFACDGTGEIGTFNLSRGSAVTTLKNDYAANWAGAFYTLPTGVSNLHTVIRGTYDADKYLASIPAEYELNGLTTEIFSDITVEGDGEFTVYAADTTFTADHITNIIRGDITGKFVGNRKGCKSVTNIIGLAEGQEGSITLTGNFAALGATVNNGTDTAVRTEFKGTPTIADGKVTGSNVVLNGQFTGSGATVAGNVEVVLDGVKIGNTGSSAGCYGTSSKKVMGDATTTITDSYVNSRYYASHSEITGDVNLTVQGASNFAGRIWGSGQSNVGGTTTTIVQAYEGRVPTIGTFYGSYSTTGKVVNKFYAGDIGVLYGMHNNDAPIENYIYGGDIATFCGYNGESTLVPESINNYIYGGNITEFYGGARNNNKAADPAPTVTVTNHLCKDPASAEEGSATLNIGTFYGGAHTNGQGYKYDITNNITNVILNGTEFYGGSKAGVDVKITNNIDGLTFNQTTDPDTGDEVTTETTVKHGNFRGTGVIALTAEATEDGEGNPIYALTNNITNSNFNVIYYGLNSVKGNVGNVKSEISNTNFNYNGSSADGQSGYSIFVLGRAAYLTGDVVNTMTNCYVAGNYDVTRDGEFTGDIVTTVNSCEFNGTFWGSRSEITGNHVIYFNGGYTGHEFVALGTKGGTGSVTVYVDKYGDEIPVFSTRKASQVGLAGSHINGTQEAEINVYIKAGTFNKPIWEGTKRDHALDYDYINIYLIGDITLLDSAIDEDSGRGSFLTGVPTSVTDVLDENKVTEVGDVRIYSANQDGWTIDKTYVTFLTEDGVDKVVPVTPGINGVYLKKADSTVTVGEENEVDVITYTGASMNFSVVMDVDARIILNVWISETDYETYAASRNEIIVDGEKKIGALKFTLTMDLSDDGSNLYVLGTGVINENSVADGGYYKFQMKAVAPDHFDKAVTFAGSAFCNELTIFEICDLGLDQNSEGDAANLFKAIYNYGASVCAGVEKKYDFAADFVKHDAADPQFYSANGLGLKFNTVSMLMGDAVGIRFSGTITDASLADKISLYAKVDGAWNELADYYYTVNVEGTDITVDFYVSLENPNENLFVGIYIDGNVADEYTGILGTCAAETYTSIKGLTEYVQNEYADSDDAAEKAKVDALAELVQACVNYQAA